MERYQTTLLPLLGRLLLGLVFVGSGLGKLMAVEPTIGYIASVGLPAPQVGYGLAVLVELGGGLLLCAGLLTRWAAVVLAVFCLFTAFVFHGFGDMESQINALKNIAMTGGFLYVVAYGAGDWSLDAMRSGRRRSPLASA